MNQLDELEQRLRLERKFWQYDSRISSQMSEGEKVEIALQVLNTPKSVMQGMSEEFARKERNANGSGQGG